MSAKPSSGPWTYNGDGFVFGGDEHPICRLIAASVADARAIAQVPALLRIVRILAGSGSKSQTLRLVYQLAADAKDVCAIIDGDICLPSHIEAAKGADYSNTPASLAKEMTPGERLGFAPSVVADYERSRQTDAVDLLRETQWKWLLVADRQGAVLGCPVCERDEQEGHAPDCPLGALLAAIDQK